MKNRYLKGVSTLKLNSDKCVGCGRCIEVCPHNVFSLENNKANIIDKDGCIECGACAKKCPGDSGSGCC